MSRRTYETDGTRATSADDLDELVIDKRQGWRATPAKARRRQRRYGKRLTKELRYSEDLWLLIWGVGWGVPCIKAT